MHSCVCAHIPHSPLLSLLEILVVALELLLLMFQLGLKLRHVALNLVQIALQHSTHTFAKSRSKHCGCLVRCGSPTRIVWP